MIEMISSNLDSFKKLSFSPGLNILIVDKSPGSTDQQTRNRAGKTCLIELIHFLLGSNCDKDSIFRNEALINNIFSMKFQIGKEIINLGRSGKNPSKILVIDGETEKWPISTHIEKKDNRRYISNSDWRKVLGELIFNIPSDIDSKLKYPPRFRAIFSYFVRRENEGGFISPITQSQNQQRFDWQISLSYLLGLDWTISQKWQITRDKEKSLNELKKIARRGDLEGIIEDAAFLKTKLTVSDNKVNKLRNEIDEFKVLTEYRNLEKEASELTEKIGELNNQNVNDRELILNLEESLITEEPPSIESLNELYEEAGITFSNLTIKRYEDLQKFHNTIIENRSSYLNEEIEEANKRIINRETAIENFSERRAEIMKILSSHGALDQFNLLRSELSKAETEIESLKQRLAAAEQLESTKIELEFERKNLHQRLKRNYLEQKEFVDRAIIIFEEISNSLYEDAGSLIISDTLNGPEFDIKIQGEKSKGIRNMQIFCFDLMLMQLCMEQKIGPDFLIHDSHLFDGVDERQVAKAIQVGAIRAKEFGFQYIITMNSDAIPIEVPDGFNFEQYFLPVHLTDKTEDGGLFGIRF